MSRGLGKQQRAVLRALDGRRRLDGMTRAAWFTLADLGVITDRTAPATQRSVRRAVAGVVERGLLQKATAGRPARASDGGPFRRSPQCGVEHRRVLCIRRTVPDADIDSAIDDLVEWREYMYRRLEAAYDKEPDGQVVYALQSELQELGGSVPSRQ